MSLINTGCILQKANSDAYVKYQDSVLEAKRGRLEIALLPGPRSGQFDLFTVTYFFSSGPVVKSENSAQVESHGPYQVYS